MDSVLIVENVSKSFGKMRAVAGVTFEVRRGAVTALVGPNGAGKTTLFNIISGLLAPDEGGVRFRGRDSGGPETVSGLRPWAVAEKGVGRLFQDTRIFKRMTVLDNVLAGFRTSPARDLLRSIFPWPAAKEEESAEDRLDTARELLEFVGLADRERSHAGALSHGQQKLLAVARLLASDPELILLDEPTAGLAYDMVEKMLRLIRQLVRPRWGKTVLLIEHNLTVVDQVAHWSGLMERGELVYFGEGGVQEAFSSTERRGAYIGLGPREMDSAPLTGARR